MHSRTMSIPPQLRLALRHIIAYVGSLPAIVFALMATALLSGEMPEYFEPPASWCCCFETHLSLVFGLVPSCVVGEFLLVRRLGWRWWVHVPLMAAVFFVVSVEMTEIWAVVQFLRGAPLEYLVGVALQDTIWGSAYWVILRLADTLLPRAQAVVAARPWDFG